MPINFTALFQDSWNFMRNQTTLVYRFIFIYALFSLGSYFLSSEMLGNSEITHIANPEQTINIEDIGIFYLLQSTSFLFLNCWAMLSVHQISQYQGFNLQQSFSKTLAKFIGVVALTVLLLLPLWIISFDILSAILTKRSPSSFALPGIIIAIFVFIRLFLAPTAYLLDDQKWSKAIGYIWKSGTKRTGTLLLFCLLTQFVFGLITQQINALAATNLVLTLIAAILLAGINLFNLILTYRFYTLFTQKAS